ncbi:MAG: hypothetical protein BGO31_16545 [Bacteroidetes bacterium 43-16]|nr:MAG: hypothetical protein BGO31_16545 [Bacteroidetes bacterium 43-16]
MNTLSTSFYIKTVLSLFLVGFAGKSLAQANKLVLKNRTTAIHTPDSRFLSMSRKASKAQPLLCYISFHSAPDRKQLATAGIQLQDYIAHNTFIALLTQPLPAQFSDKNIAGWAEAKAADKISDYFNSLDQSSTVTVFLSLGTFSDTSAISSTLAKAKAHFANDQPWTSQNKWIVNTTVAELETIAANPNILSISPKFEDQSLNYQAIAYTNAELARKPEGFGLLGNNIVIGVGDDTYPEHIDFNNRVTNFNPNLLTDHGIHTAGTTAGAGNRYESYTGYAPKAKLVTDYFSRVIANAQTYEQSFNMKVTNNSYAAIVGNCAYAGTYDATSQYMDQLSLSNPELFNVFAAGNDGGMTCGPFPLRYGTVVGSFQAAKNTLVVGLTGKYEDHINNGGSSGPVKDGRLKPEITAPGHQIISTTFNNDYRIMSGTSMACPTVSGAAALLQERFKQLNGNQYPSNALLKTILMNSASDLGNAGPDYVNGFGRLNVGKALEVINNNLYLTGTVNHLGQQSHSIPVPANTAQVKIMLYWNDAPASPNNPKALVNDLDLTVTTPSGGANFPLVLNPDPAHVTDLAVQGADHLNNVEQVVIDNPAAGNYTVNISGFNIPTASQQYVIVYTYIPNEIEISYPTAGTKMEANVSTLIQWEAPGNSGDFTISYSIDNGSNWQNVGTATAQKRYTLWTPVNIATDQAIIRVSRPGNTTTTGRFSIIAMPVPQLSAEQCPGSISIEWPAITGSTRYYLYRQIGAEMTLIDSTTGTNYTFTGLNADSTYWVSVAASVNNAKGLRGLALSRKPETGSCNSPAFNGDLAIRNVIAPLSGRQFTLSALSSNATLTLNIDNRDNSPCNSFELSYRINNGSWITSTHSTTIPALGQIPVSVSGLNLSAFGVYNIDAVVRNLSMSDPIPQNDTIRFSIKHIPNPAIDLATDYLETYENTAVATYQNNTLGIDFAEKFDFDISKPLGRLRTFVNIPVTIDGSRSLSMDMSANQKNDTSASSLNQLRGTFNLNNYNISQDEIRFEFDYRLHSVPLFDTMNRVKVRGTETDPWIALQPFDTNLTGSIQKYGQVMLRDILAANGQQYSTSTQVAIQQRDITLISGINYGTGLTLDNFRIFIAQNDIGLVKTLNIQNFNCGLSNAVPLQVEVANTMMTQKTNIPIFYQVDNQSIVSELIPSINAKDTIIYTFSNLMDLAAPGAHNLRIWIAFPGDNYPSNDTLKDIKIHNQPVVQTFPYLENFETNDGYYFTDGKNSSWAYGIPNSTSLDHAASGQRAWKTGLTTSYNSEELSYLYSPCFNLSSLAQPMLSFSLFSEIETPGSDGVYDSAYVEYSIDGGLSWSLLGRHDEGYNWYNEVNHSWTGTSTNYWQVASIPLPNAASLSLRWVFSSDVGAQFGGIGLDDIHIFDYIKPISDEDSFPVPITHNVSGITEFAKDGNISGIIDPLSQNIGPLNFQSYKHSTHVSQDSQQLFLPRNFGVTKAGNGPVDSIQLSLYVRDSLMKVVRSSTACSTCPTHPREVYQLGVTTYTDNNPGLINNSLEDDSNGVFLFIPSEKVTWVPYFDGYYAQFKTNQVGEYWFNDGGLTRSNPLPLNTLNFIAEKQGERQARLRWINTIDDQVANYQLQHDEGQGFQALAQTGSIHDPLHEYVYIDTPGLPARPYVEYRLKYTSLDGKVFYGPVRKLQWENLPSRFEVFPNPTHDGTVYFRWYNNKQESFNWAVYSVAGHKIASGWIDQNRFSGTEKISLKNAAHVGDLYVLKIQFKNSSEEYKIIYQPQ